MALEFVLIQGEILWKVVTVANFSNEELILAGAKLGATVESRKGKPSLILKGDIKFLINNKEISFETVYKDIK